MYKKYHSEESSYSPIITEIILSSNNKTRRSIGIPYCDAPISESTLNLFLNAFKVPLLRLEQNWVPPFSNNPDHKQTRKAKKMFICVPWSNPATQGFPQITHLLAVDEEMGRRFRFSVAATTHHGQLHGSNPLRQIVLGRQAIVQKSPSRHLRFEGRVSLPNIFKAEDLLRPLVTLLCLRTISLQAFLTEKQPLGEPRHLRESLAPSEREKSSKKWRSSPSHTFSLSRSSRLHPISHFHRPFSHLPISPTFLSFFVLSWNSRWKTSFRGFSPVPPDHNGPKWF